MKNNFDKNNFYSRYINLTYELVVLLFIGVYGGIWLDKKTGLSFPLFVWLFPIIAITISLIKIVKDTSKKN